MAIKEQEERKAGLDEDKVLELVQPLIDDAKLKWKTEIERS